MALEPGTRLGPYEILAPLGAGGMGEVYRARDTRLDRTVAIKVLPANLAPDVQLRDRFEREARAISSLQHPHICALYDVGAAPNPSASDSDDRAVQFLVLEYLEGETLAARLARTGPVAVPEALKIAAEICDALDKAHRSHIVHRDLKPANVMLTKSGAKLLDFGLAKAATPVVASGLSMLPTTPPALTQQGAILGTFQYMAPEQIEGLEADARTDIFAFGAMLFEMLTARPPFEGKSRAHLLGAILKDEPPPVSTLKPAAPPALDRIVAVCLAKDPDDRYQSARDLLRDLKSVDPTQTASSSSSGAKASSTNGWLFGAIALAAVLAGIAIGRWAPRQTQPAAEPVQFTFAPPPSNTFATPPGGGTGTAPQIAVSPDGRQIAFVASGPNAAQIWVRPLGGAVARAIAGTDDGSFPFWSPDGRYIGFFAQGSLKKVGVEGGAPVVLCDAIAGRGGSWNKDNVIIFTANTTGPVQRVPAAGGVPTPASVMDAKVGDTNHRFPGFLPDGKHFLFTSVYGTCCPAPRPGHIKVGTLDSMETRELLQVESTAVFAAGHVLFNRGGILMAQRLDEATRTLIGEPFTVADRVASEGSRYTSVSAADNTLVYFGGSGTALSRLEWLDRAGKSLGTAADESLWLGPNLSPDGRRIAVALTAGSPPNRDIWILDTAGKNRSHLTFDPGDDNAPVWSPDQKYIAWQGNRGGRSTVLKKAVNGGSDEEVMIRREESVPGAIVPSDWSSDGRYLLFGRSQGVEGSADIWLLPLFGDRKPVPLVQTRFTENSATFSPDIRWFAYTSTESGTPQIYVQPFPTTGAKFHVSPGGTGGAIQPQWSKDGRELLYMELDPAGTRMMSVPIRTKPEFEAGAPQPLFRFPSIVTYGGSSFRAYSMTSDGKQFLVSTMHQQITTPMTVMLNWLGTRR